ncbi:MAG: prepilin peptidase [Kiritimatiellae bacterium]|nr:prepilin peptidase [Kiritimatiellia bacterium]
MNQHANILKELMPILAFFSFWLGACIASFLNVVIWRVPRGESIVSPPSHCPKCNSPIRWYQNIPILSWLALRGKCANCRAPISPRYICVELLGGLLFLAVFLHLFGGDGKPVVAPFGQVTYIGGIFILLVWWIWISLMIAGSFIDFDHQLLPDFTTVGGMVLGVLFWAFVSASTRNFAFDFSDLRMYFPLAYSISGLVFGFGLLWLVRWIGSKVFKREAMGMGDVFLMGAVGALFGPIAVLVTLILSSVVGSVVGVSLILISKTKLGGFTPIPYGPYICIGCLSWMFFGPQLVDWYLRLVVP